MKKLLLLLAVLFISCQKEKVEPVLLQCSIQYTSIFLPVGNNVTKEIRGVYTPEELVNILKGYDMYLINCVHK